MRLMATLGVDVQVDPLASPPCVCKECLRGWRKLVSSSVLDPRNRRRRPGSRLGGGFPEVLRAARRARGLTQVELSRAIGGSTSLVTQYETGRCRPSPDTLKALEYVLGRPLG